MFALLYLKEAKHDLVLPLANITNTFSSCWKCPMTLCVSFLSLSFCRVRDRKFRQPKLARLDLGIGLPMYFISLLLLFQYTPLGRKTKGKMIDKCYSFILFYLISFYLCALIMDDSRLHSLMIWSFSYRLSSGR